MGVGGRTVARCRQNVNRPRGDGAFRLLLKAFRLWVGGSGSRTDGPQVCCEPSASLVV
jgi:hypothetical protein